MPVTLQVIESTTTLGVEVVEVVLASASAPGPAGPGVPTGGTVNQVLTKDSGTDYDTSWQDAQGGAGGAPTDADYLVGTAHGDLSAEIVVGATPGGELGGTWASPTVDATHSGSSHAAVLAAAEATAASALATHTADTTSVHGIADTSVLATDSEVATAVSDHNADTTSVHGIADTAALALTANHPTNATFNDHSARHEDGGADEIVVTSPMVSSGAATDGQVLTADGAGAATWEDSTGGLVGEVLFDSVLGADAATIDSGAGGFSTSYKALRIVIYSRTTQAAVGGSFSLVFNNDSGNNYDRQVLTVTNTTVAGAIALAATSHVLSTLGANALANAFGAMVIEIPNYGGTTGMKPMISNMVRMEDTAADCVSGLTHGNYRSTSAISRVAITAGGGSDFLAGTRMTIFGLG